MKILMFGDMAGVGQIITHYLNKNGIHAELYNFRHDLFSNFYKPRIFPSFKSALFNALKDSRKFDIIHINSIDYCVPLFSILRKKVVLHYHGSDIMNRNGEMIDISRSFADTIIYNSENMKPKLDKYKKIFYMRNLIDTELFFPKSKGSGKLAIISSNLDKQKTLNLIPKDSEIIDLDKGITQYEEMSDLLNKYETFVDEKITDYGIYCDLLSCTALQALACGLKVIHGGQVFQNLPEESKPKNYIIKLIGIYKELLQ